MLTRDGQDYSKQWGGGTSKQWGTYEFDHEWKLYDGNRLDHYHEKVQPMLLPGAAVPQGKFNQDPDDGVVNKFSTSSPFYDPASPGDGYRYETIGDYTGGGPQVVTQINQSETTTTTHHWQLAEILSEYQIGSMAPFTYSTETKKQTNQSQQIAIDSVDDDFTTTTNAGVVTKTGYVSTYRKSTGAVGTAGANPADEWVADHHWDRQEVKTIDGGQSVWHQVGDGSSQQHTTQDDFEQWRTETFDTAINDQIELKENSKIRSSSSAQGESTFTYDYTKGDLAAFNGLTEHEEGTDHFVRSGLVENDFSTRAPDGTLAPVTILGSSGNDPDEQGIRKRHWKTRDTHTEWGTGTYEDHKKSIVSGRKIQNDDRGELKWNEDPASTVPGASSFENVSEILEDITETLSLGSEATTFTERRSNSSEKQHYQRFLGNYEGQAHEGQVTVTGSTGSVGDNGYFSREQEFYTQTDDSVATTDFAALLTDSVDSAGVLTRTGTDNRYWESSVTSDRSGWGSWNSTHNWTPGVTTSAQDIGTYTFLRHTFVHDKPTDEVTYNSDGSVTDHAHDTGDANSHHQFVIPDGWYSYATTSGSTTNSETGSYKDNSESWTDSMYDNDVTTTYLANSPNRELRGTRVSRLSTWGNGSYTAELNKTVDNSSAKDTGTRDYQTYLHNAFNVDTDVSIVEQPAQTTETHTIRDYGSSDGYARSNLNGTLTYTWSSGAGTANSAGLSSSNAYVAASDENHDGTWTDNLITAFVTDSNGQTTSRTDGQIDDEGRTWGKNTRTNDDTISMSRSKTSNGVTQVSSDTSTRVNYLVVDYDHNHDNQTAISNNKATQVNAHEFGSNEVQRKNGRVNITESATWDQGDVTLGNGIHYRHTKNYNDYQYANTKADYNDTTTSKYQNGQLTEYSGTFQVSNGTLNSGTAKSGSELVEYESATTDGTHTTAQALHSDITFADNSFRNLSSFSQSLMLNADGSSTNQQQEQGTSGTTQNYSEEGYASTWSQVSDPSTGNGSTFSGQDLFEVTSSNGSYYVSTLNITSAQTNGIVNVGGYVQSTGGGAGGWIANYESPSNGMVSANSPNATKFNFDGTFSRDLSSTQLYAFGSGWRLERDSATGTVTFTRSDSGTGDTEDDVTQTTHFHPVNETGDLSAATHVWEKSNVTYDSVDHNSRELHYDYGSSSTQTELANGTRTTTGAFSENWDDTVTSDDNVHEVGHIDQDNLTTYPSPLGNYWYRDWGSSDWDRTLTSDKSWNVSGTNSVQRLANGTIISSSTGPSGTATEEGSEVETSSGTHNWASSGGGSTSESDSSNSSSSYGPTTTTVTTIPVPWFGLPRDANAGDPVVDEQTPGPKIFPGDPSVHHRWDLGRLEGAATRTQTFGTLGTWSVPMIEAYYVHPGVVARDLPVRALINGHAAETGGPQWASERDGSELVRTVEHLRGLGRADGAEALLTHPICEPPTNPWSNYGQLVVWPSRIAGANALIGDLPINVVLTVPASEMQGFAETLRRHYQSEETAQKLDDRDRSLSMPPRTVADANPQLNGWMAEAALTAGRLELNPDTMRRADSGKFDDGGKEETKQLGEAYKSDPPAESLVNNPAAASGQLPFLWTVLITASLGEVPPEIAPRADEVARLQQLLNHWLGVDQIQVAPGRNPNSGTYNLYYINKGWLKNDEPVLIGEYDPSTVKDNDPLTGSVIRKGLAVPLRKVDSEVWHSGTTEDWDGWFEENGTPVIPKHKAFEVPFKNIRAGNYTVAFDGETTQVQAIALLGPTLYALARHVVTSIASDVAAGQAVKVVAIGSKIALRYVNQQGQKVLKYVEGKLADKLYRALGRNADEAAAALEHEVKLVVRGKKWTGTWSEFLDEAYGGIDALGKKHPGKRMSGAINDTHAHHIVMKGRDDWAGVLESRAILKRYGIDYLTSQECLVWAPNVGHTEAYVWEVYQALKAVDEGPRTREAIVEALKNMARKFIDRATRN